MRHQIIILIGKSLARLALWEVSKLNKKVIIYPLKINLNELVCCLTCYLTLH